MAPALTAGELESGDLYEHLRERHGVQVSKAVQTIEPTVVSQAESRLLEVPHLSPALLFERLTTDTDDRPVEYVHSICRGDRYRLVSRLSLDSPPVPGAAHPGGLAPGMAPGTSAPW